MGHESHDGNPACGRIGFEGASAIHGGQPAGVEVKEDGLWSGLGDRSNAVCRAARVHRDAHGFRRLADPREENEILNQSYNCCRHAITLWRIFAPGELRAACSSILENTKPRVHATIPNIPQPLPEKRREIKCRRGCARLGRGEVRRMIDRPSPAGGPRARQPFLLDCSLDTIDVQLSK
jgi:hypothetical protein